jgi:hypothetical protein
MLCSGFEYFANRYAKMGKGKPDCRDTGQDGQDKDVDFHGAAIINRDGTETLITEDMVQDAFEQLESDPDKPTAQ